MEIAKLGGSPVEEAPREGARDGHRADAPAVLFEDEHLLAINKPAGLVTHPAYRHPSGTLCDLVFARQAARGERRPWLLHRLDRETSGLILFAKTDIARRALVSQFERHRIRKQYLAITLGVPPEGAGLIDMPLRRDPLDRRRTIVDPSGQFAMTRYQQLVAADGLALVVAEPVTGRTHQIRAHLAWLGVPVLGDSRYMAAGQVAMLPISLEAAAPRVMLHAWRLHLRWPLTGTPSMLSAPLPADFKAILRRTGMGRLDITNTYEQDGASDPRDDAIALVLQELQEELCS